MKTLEEIRNYFRNDIFATEMTGIIIEHAKKGFARCSFNITGQHKNAVNGVMGGAIYTLADFTFAVAANFDNDLTVTLNSSISFTGTPSGARVIAEASCIKETRHNAFYEVRVSDDLGNQVAFVSFGGYKKHIS